jgi:acyl-CoA synthetase (AMP-forming)/AMP-acid ligase II
VSIAVIQAALRALSRTGLLGAHPLGAILRLVWMLLRRGCSLFTLVAWNARRFPDAVAVVDPHRRATFRQLERRAAQMAQALDLGAHQRVGILCRNSLVFVEALLACGRAGADAVLLSTMFATEQITHLCETDRLDLLICDDEFRAQVATLATRFPGLSGRVVSTAALVEENLGQLPRPAPRGPRRRLVRKAGAVVIMTSGTTGPARAVRHRPSLRHLLRTVTALLDQLQLKCGEPTLLTIPLLHGHGLATLGMSLALAAPLFIFPRARAEELLTCIAQNKIRVVVLVPTILRRLLDGGMEGGTIPVRQVICGSAPLAASLATQGMERLGPILFNLYGSTEAGLISLATPEDLRVAPTSVGRTLPGVSVDLQTTDGASVGPGQIGRLRVRGGLVQGKANASAGIDTGDLAHFGEDGRMYLDGRADDVLICGGENVLPKTVEDMINRRPYVLASAAVGVPSVEYGQSIHLFVELRAGFADVSQVSIADDLKAYLPPVLRPTDITIVSALPRGPSGKILRRQLKVD